MNNNIAKSLQISRSNSTSTVPLRAPLLQDWGSQATSIAIISGTGKV